MGWVDSHKPAAAVHVHLMMAWLMWVVVGASLLGFGVRWVWREPLVVTLWLVGAAATVGILKSRLVLDRAARRITDRIRQRGDGRCLGGFLSLRSWALVAAMAAGGRLLRSGPVAVTIIGLLYIAVGTALLLSARIPWRAWAESRRLV